MPPFFDNLHLKYKMPGSRAPMVYPNNSIPLIKEQSYSYSGDGMDYRALQRRDWDPNISGKFNGSGVDYNYTQGNFAAKRDFEERGPDPLLGRGPDPLLGRGPDPLLGRGDLGAGYTSVAAGQLFRAAGDNSTVEQDLLYALIGSAVEQYIQNSIILWILSAVGLIVWLITIVLVVQLSFPQYVPRQLSSMPSWQKLQKVDVQWWLILAILLTSLVGLNFPNVQNYLMIILGVLLIVWFGIRWANAQKQWIILLVGIVLLFSGAIREFVDYSGNAFFMATMRWPSMACCILLLVDIFYVSRVKA